MKIVLEHLTKRYPSRDGGDDVIAVNDFTFEIPDGKLIGLCRWKRVEKTVCRACSPQ